MAVPGVVDPAGPRRGHAQHEPHRRGHRAHLEGRFDVPVALGNDVQPGHPGRGVAGLGPQAPRSAVGIFVGTGIGGGFVARASCGAAPGIGRRDRPHRHADRRPAVRLRQPRLPGGPGQPHGHRARHPRGRRPPAARRILTELSGGDLSVIRSGASARPWRPATRWSREIVHRAAEVLGYACLTVRHLIDPEVIVLGGGVIEACSDFILPIVENIVGSRPPARRPRRRPRAASALGDDAVVARRRGPRPNPRRPQPVQEALTPSARATSRSPATASARSPSGGGATPRHLHPRRRHGRSDARRPSPARSITPPTLSGRRS